MLKRQHGMTMIGILFVLALIGVIGYAGMRILPLYLNYMKVARSTVREAVRSDTPPHYERTRRGSLVDAVEPETAIVFTYPLVTVA